MEVHDCTPPIELTPDQAQDSRSACAVSNSIANLNRSSIKSNIILVNDYLIAHLYNYIVRDVDMKSNTYQNPKLRNFDNFDKVNALNIHLGMKEIGNEHGQVINLPCPNTNSKEIVCSLNSTKPSLHGNMPFPKHFKRNPVGIFDGSWVNIHKNEALVGNHDGIPTTANICDVHNAAQDHEPIHNQEFNLELDSHANMPVVGKGAHVEYTGRTADVNAFSPKYDTAQLPIVDAIIQYDCPHTGQSYLLVIRNALYVPEMMNHLIPPFIMREAGINVHDTPKIHLDDPGISDHSIEFPETNLRIPLSLNGMFSYFPTSKLTAATLRNC